MCTFNHLLPSILSLVVEFPEPFPTDFNLKFNCRLFEMFHRTVAGVEFLHSATHVYLQPIPTRHFGNEPFTQKTSTYRQEKPFLSHFLFHDTNCGELYQQYHRGVQAEFFVNVPWSLCMASSEQKIAYIARYRCIYRGTGFVFKRNSSAAILVRVVEIAKVAVVNPVRNSPCFTTAWRSRVGVGPPWCARNEMRTPSVLFPALHPGVK